MTEPNVAGPRHTAIANPLFEFLLRLGDDRLVLGHRTSEWCGHGPLLEEDIALTNIALDLVGQANAVLTLAGDVEGAGRDADALAYLRDERAFRNAQIVELPTGDFGFTIARQFFFDAFSVVQWEMLSTAHHETLAGIAAKALKEDRYHLRHSSEWMVRLGDGTAESKDRVQRSVNELWRFTGELLDHDSVDAAVAAHGIVVDHEAARARWSTVVAAVLKRATLELPTDTAMVTGGRRGQHTEALGHMLSEMQIVARSHPGASW